MDLSLQQITYLITVAEQQSFGKAAKLCYVTQPTLSMQVKKAEEVLGFSFFNRDRNPIELTTAGQQMLPLLYELKAAFQEIIRFSEQKKGIVKDELKIGIIPTIAAYMVPSLFAHKRQFSPHVNIQLLEVKSEEVLALLAAKKIDIGIMAGPVQQEELEVQPLFNEEILAFLPSEKKAKIHVSQLTNLQPWLLSAGNCLRTQMIHFCQLAENNLFDWNYEGGNLEMLLKMVQQFGGYTLVPSFYQKLYQIDQKQLKHIYSEEQTKFPARNVIGLCSHRNKKRPEIQQIFQFIKKEYANHEGKNFEVLNWK